MPDLNYQALGFYMALAQWAAMGLMGVWVYLRTKDEANAKALAKLETQLALFISESGKANENQNSRIAVLEEVVKHAPTAEEISEISQQVASLQSEVKGVNQLLQRVEHQTQLIHTHLLRNRE